MAHNNKVEIVQRKIFVIVVCTDLPSSTIKEREYIEEQVNLIDNSLITGWKFPIDESWQKYAKRSSYIEENSKNEVVCQEKPKTNKHYILFN